MPTWDPTAYLEFADDRSRPFFDLTNRIDVVTPETVVDLGCGPGQLTATLAARWPAATIEGLDSSTEMIDAAAKHEFARLHFQVGDLTDWRPGSAGVDVVISNATLQWVPDHRQLLPRLVSALKPGGWLAIQVPGNFDEPSHRLLHGLAADPRFADATRGVARPSAYDAATYLGDLESLDCAVDAWETTYLHVLTGPDPVFRWISGTGARPILQALSDTEREEFAAEYRALLRDAYIERDFGTVLPFRRIFVVAQKSR